MRKEDIILEAPQSKKKGTLILFHGLTGTPDEMRDVATYFNTRGFRIVLPCLSGHGTSIEELKRIKEEVWLQDAERAFEDAQIDSTENLFSIGQSFGALLSLYLLTKYPAKFQAVALLSPPLRFSSFVRELMLSMLDFAPESMLDSLGVIKKQSRENPGFVRPREAYSEHSIAAAVRLFRIRGKVLAGLARVEKPMLLLQDPADHHISVDAVNILRTSSPLSPIEHRWIPGGQHEIAMGPKQEVVLKELERFLNSMLTSKSEP